MDSTGRKLSFQDLQARLAQGGAPLGGFRPGGGGLPRQRRPGVTEDNQQPPEDNEPAVQARRRPQVRGRRRPTTRHAFRAASVTFPGVQADTTNWDSKTTSADKDDKDDVDMQEEPPRRVSLSSDEVKAHHSPDTSWSSSAGGNAVTQEPGSADSDDSKGFVHVEVPNDIPQRPSQLNGPTLSADDDVSSQEQQPPSALGQQRRQRVCGDAVPLSVQAQFVVALECSRMVNLKPGWTCGSSEIAYLLQLGRLCASAAAGTTKVDEKVLSKLPEFAAFKHKGQVVKKIASKKSAVQKLQRYRPIDGRIFVLLGDGCVTTLMAQGNSQTHGVILRTSGYGTASEHLRVPTLECGPLPELQAAMIQEAQALLHKPKCQLWTAVYTPEAEYTDVLDSIISTWGTDRARLAVYRQLIAQQRNADSEEQHEAELARLRSSVTMYHQQLDAALRRCQQLTEHNNHLMDQVDELQRTLASAPSPQELARVKEETEQYKKRTKEQWRDLRKRDQQIEELQYQLSDLSAKAAEASARASPDPQQSERVQQLEHDVQQYSKQVDVQREKATKARRALHDARLQNEEWERQVNELKQRVLTLNEQVKVVARDNEVLKMCPDNAQCRKPDCRFAHTSRNALVASFQDLKRTVEDKTLELRFAVSAPQHQQPPVQDLQHNQAQPIYPRTASAPQRQRPPAQDLQLNRAQPMCPRAAAPAQSSAPYEQRRRQRERRRSDMMKSLYSDDEDDDDDDNAVNSLYHRKPLKGHDAPVARQRAHVPPAGIHQDRGFALVDTFRGLCPDPNGDNSDHSDSLPSRQQDPLVPPERKEREQKVPVFPAHQPQAAGWGHLDNNRNNHFDYHIPTPVAHDQAARDQQLAMELAEQWKREDNERGRAAAAAANLI